MATVIAAGRNAGKLPAQHWCTYGYALEQGACAACHAQRNAIRAARAKKKPWLEPQGYMYVSVRGANGKYGPAVAMAELNRPRCGPGGGGVSCVPTLAAVAQLAGAALPAPAGPTFAAKAVWYTPCGKVGDTAYVYVCPTATNPKRRVLLRP